MSKLSTRRVFGALALMQAMSEANAAYMATTYYEDWCNGSPTEFELSSTSTCSDSSCAYTSWHSHYASQTSCGVINPDAHALTVFGNDTVYLYVRAYEDDACTQEKYVQGWRLYDGNCIGIDETSSFSFSLRTDATLQEKVFNSANCTGSVSSWSQWSGSDVLNNKCVNKVKFYARYPVYMSPQGYIVDRFFTDASCTTPNRVLFTPRDVFFRWEEATCQQNADGIYYTRDQYMTFDPKATAASVFGETTTYMIEESFLDGDCVADTSVSVYRADGECINMGGYSGAYTLDKSNGAYVYNLYEGSSCGGSGLVFFRLAASNQNNGACNYHRKFYSHVAVTPAPTTSTPAPTPSPSATAVNNQGASSASSIAVSIATIVAGFAAMMCATFMRM